MKSIPIFYVHKGFSNIIYYTIGQTRKYNPNSEIIFLGDESNILPSEYNVSHQMIKDYFKRADRFKDIFVNMSPNNADYECFCFQRWFVIAEYLKSREDIDEFVYFDTDVMIYRNVSQYSDYVFENCEMSICMKCGPQYSFFKRETLFEFVDYIYEYYSNPEKLEQLTAHYNQYFIAEGHYGGICDMTLLEWFSRNHKTFNTNDVIENGIFDNSVNQAEGFRMKGKIKRIFLYEDGYAGVRQDGAIVKFWGLHFQGAAKWKMYQYYNGDKKLVPPKYKSMVRAKLFIIKSTCWKYIRLMHLNKLLKRIFGIKKPIA